MQQLQNLRDDECILLNFRSGKWMELPEDGIDA